MSALPAILLANSRAIGAVWNLFGATNQLTACVSMLVVLIYVLRFRKYNWKYAVPFLVPIAWLMVVITWALIDVIKGYFDKCSSITCDWTSTVPTIPTIGLAFVICILVFAVYLEIAFYFAQNYSKPDDSGIDETGKLSECQVCGSAELPGFRCC